MPVINQLPTPPSRNDPANFSARADDFLAALPGWTDEANALLGEVNATRDQVQAKRDELIEAGLENAAANALLASEKADAAASSAALAQGAWRAVRGRNYGPLAADPTVNPNGDPCREGDEYFNTVSKLVKRFNGAGWVVTDLVSQDLASSVLGKGSALVGFDGGTVEEVLKTLKPIATYTALRNYTGFATSVRITQFGLAGPFDFDPLDTTSEDDGGTILVGVDGRRWKRRYEGDADVRWWGARLIGVSYDDTPHIQAALSAAKGADGTGAGRSIFSVRIPNVPGGFAKITDTLVIDGTHGLALKGDGALTRREMSAPEGAVRWYGETSKPILQVKGCTGVPSNPNFMIFISDLTMSGHATFVTPGNEIPENLALSCIHIGNLDGAATATLTRNLLIKNVRLTDSRFGLWSGNPDGLNADHASVYLESSYINRCPQAGVRWGTGNSILIGKGNHITNNGWGAASFPVDDYSSQRGANVLVNSGYVDLYGLTTAGSGDYKPVSADIYQEGGRCSVYGAWSDTEGYFLYQGGGSQSGSGYHAPEIRGVRHYNSSFSEANTPDSLRIVVPGTVVHGMFYGNIVVDSGSSGRPIFEAIQFGRANATFKGSGVNVQRSLIHIGSNGNFAQITLGGANSGVEFKHKGNKPPRLLLLGNTAAADSVLQVLGPDASSSGFQVALEENSGQLRILVNGFFSGTDSATPLNVNQAMHYITVGGTNSFSLFTYDPNGSNSQVALSSFTSQGGFVCAPVNGSRSEVAFRVPRRASSPSYSSGDYWEGCQFFDTAAKKFKGNTGGGTWVDFH